MNIFKLKFVCAAVIALSAGGGIASANLINNPGFETPTPKEPFAGWTTTPAASGSFFDVDQFVAHSGSLGAFFGGVTVGSYDSISQTFATTAGSFYIVSFWLENLGDPPSDFRVLFGGNLVLDELNATAFPYTQFTFSLLATGSSTTLEFQAYHVPSYFGLDDVSVTNSVPDASSTAMLLGLALSGLSFLRRKLS